MQRGFEKQFHRCSGGFFIFILLCTFALADSSLFFRRPASAYGAARAGLPRFAATFAARRLCFF
ncbi:hypothetical protein [Paraburkholderia antibiotica]|uniref:Uncharacterized protein n=1 Tax=Paraburkholderia antibiotica TaxID=2728839 RepID=A0A7X9ZX44_9BURK|nr:hypothetical protein [Paraburkholderia antibiotica]NML31416.1 hypothetical protein [Paraburkholderia antibiotica]